MKKTISIVAIIILAGFIGLLVFNNYKKNEIISDSTRSTIEETVNNFGNQLQKVSLLAPEDILKASIQSQYSSFVSTELLNNWLTNPQNAPGRTVSSPWPDHIEINSIQSSKKGYEVKGDIVFMTSNEVEHGGETGRQSIYLFLKNIDGKLLITDYTVEQ